MKRSYAILPLCLLAAACQQQSMPGSPTAGQPSNIGKTVADPRMVMSLMARTYSVCQRDPTAVAADVWQEMKLELSDPLDEHWKADTATCRQYNDNPDDGSGFVIWLDGYNRHYNVTEKSVLDSQKTLDAFLAACKKKPDARMIDVMQETLKNSK